MEFVKARAGYSGRLAIKKFDGGYNDCGSAEKVEDNQLTDCLNLWWKDGALRTRPGVTPLLSSRSDVTGRAGAMSGGSTDITGSNGRVHKFALVYEREIESTSYLYNAVLSTVDYEGSEVRSTIRANMDEGEYGSIMLVESSGMQWDGTAENCALVFLTHSVLGVDNSILAQPYAVGSPWVDVSDKAYVPLIMIDGAGCASLSSAGLTGTLYEGMNLLTPRFRAQFTTASDAKYYFLPQKQLDDVQVQADFTSADGTVTSFVIPEGSNISQTVNNRIVHVNRIGGYLYVTDASGVLSSFEASGIRNNFEVTVSKTNAGDREKICGMRFCTWFGGCSRYDPSDYNGGTRLFVSGNASYPNLLHWSDVNNPLYFPKNNCAYIGDAGQAITAFAKQGEKFVIFKEREMYYATYTAGSRVTQVLKDGTVVDATASDASFPVTQLHPFIGCDCPGTIQLCDNRLVWADSDGKVYTLVGASAYSESNVRRASRNIEGCLAQKAKAQLKQARSGDYCGQYVLMVGNDFYLFDYRNANYLTFVQSSIKAGDGAQIPWMLWSFDGGLTLDFMMANGDSMMLSGTMTSNDITHRFNAVLDGSVDTKVVYENEQFSTETLPISGVFQTRLYDFSLPEGYKDVRQVYLELNGDSGASVEVSYDTERGACSEAAPFAAEACGILRLTPGVRRVRCFGLRLQSSGGIAVGGMAVGYRMIGRRAR